MRQKRIMGSHLSEFIRQPRGHLWDTAVTLVVVALVLSPGCVQSERTLPSPTATYVPPPTATPTRTVGPVQSILSMPPAEISTRAGTMIYDGIINQESYNLFRRIVATSDTSIDTIQITSYGGESSSSQKMGHWVYDNDIDVIVEDFCFSACANYIFTAGRNKEIMADSIVGWHGSNLLSEYRARELGISVDEQLRLEFDAFLEDNPSAPLGSLSYHLFKKSRLEQAEEDRKFFEKISVNGEVTIYGALPEHHAAMHRNGDHHYAVWTFTIEVMEKFGINNVSYEGEGEYPSKRSLEKYPDILVFKVAE